MANQIIKQSKEEDAKPKPVDMKTFWVLLLGFDVLARLGAVMA